MGKFDGKLFVSDYDNTYQFTEGALRSGGVMPPVSPRNLEAIRYWMGEGGRFAIATGRALAAFRQHAEAIPMNAPAIVGNGGGIYDLAAQQYLVKRFLPENVLERLAAAAAAFPGISLEMYHEGPLVQVFSPTDWNRKHALLTGLGFQEVERLDRESVSLPLSKALFAAERDELEALLTYLQQQGWAEDYELIFSSDHLLELTAKGANKGAMALELRLPGADLHRRPRQRPPHAPRGGPGLRAGQRRSCGEGRPRPSGRPLSGRGHSGRHGGPGGLSA